MLGMGEHDPVWILFDLSSAFETIGHGNLLDCYIEMEHHIDLILLLSPGAVPENSTGVTVAQSCGN